MDEAAGDDDDDDVSGCYLDGPDYGDAEAEEEMYAGEPATAVNNMKGIELQTTAESIIMNVMLRRCDILAPSAWQGLVTRVESDPIVSLTEFATAWAGMQDSLQEREVMALFSRFGSPNDDLLNDLSRAAESKVDRAYLYGQSWRSYDSRAVKELFAPSAEINRNALYDFISIWEDALNLIEIQISRSDRNILEETLLNRPLSGRTLSSLLAQLGIPGVTAQQIQPIVMNALQFHNVSDGLTLLDLQTYCRARAGRTDASGTKLRMFRDLDSLLRPFACSSSSSRAPKNILSIFTYIPSESSCGEKKSLGFLSAMERNFPDVQYSLLEALTKCLTSKRKNNYQNGVETISLSTLESFCYPQGFSVSVLMSFGSFKAKNSKVKPLDPTEKLYVLAKKQLFLNLRKHRHSDPSLRVPDDLKLFADKEHTVLIPNSDSLSVINVIDNNTKLYGVSEYVTDVLEHDKYEVLKMDVLEEKLRMAFEKENIAGTVSNMNNNHLNNSLNRPLSASSSNAQLKASKEPLRETGAARASPVKVPKLSGRTAPSHSENETAMSGKSSDLIMKNRKNQENENSYRKSLSAENVGQKNKNQDPESADHKNGGRKKERGKEMEVVPADADRKLFLRTQQSLVGNRDMHGMKHSREDLGPSFQIPPAPPFFGLESEANTWGVPMTLKYLTDEVELGVYSESFLRCEVTGHSLICLDEERVVPLGIQHPVHQAKVLGHAQKLRLSVLEFALTRRPINPLDWRPEHVASWLHFVARCPASALKVLQRSLTGLDIATTSYPDLVDLFGGTGGGGEAEIAARTIKVLFEKCEVKSEITEDQEGDVEDKGDDAKEKGKRELLEGVDSEGLQERKGSLGASAALKRNPSTAIKLRREKEAAKRLSKELEGQEIQGIEDKIKKADIPVREERMQSDKIIGKQEIIQEDKNQSRKSENGIANKENGLGKCEEILTVAVGNETGNKKEDSFEKKRRILRKRSVQIPEKSSEVLAMLTAVEPPADRIVESSSGSSIVGKAKGKEKEKEIMAGKEKEKKKEKEEDKSNKMEREAFEAEKVRFESKISSLQQMLERQSNSVSELRELTASLRTEQSMATLAAQEAEREKRNLKISRDETADLLEHLTHSYMADMETEKIRLKAELQARNDLYYSPHKSVRSASNSSIPVSSPDISPATSASFDSFSSFPHSPSPLVSLASFPSSSLKRKNRENQNHEKHNRENQIRENQIRENQIRENQDRELQIIRDTLNSKNKSHEKVALRDNKSREIEKNEMETIDETEIKYVIKYDEKVKEKKKETDIVEIKADESMWRDFLATFSLPAYERKGLAAHGGKEFGWPSDGLYVPPQPRHAGGGEAEKRKGWDLGPMNSMNKDSNENNKSRSERESDNEDGSDYFCFLLRVVAARWMEVGYSILDQHKRLLSLGESARDSNVDNNVENRGSDGMRLLDMLQGLSMCAALTCTDIKRSLGTVEEHSSVHSEHEMAFCLTFCLSLIHRCSAAHQSTAPVGSDLSQNAFILAQIKSGGHCARECSVSDFKDILSRSLGLPVAPQSNATSSSPSPPIASPAMTLPVETLFREFDPQNKGITSSVTLFLFFQNLVPLCNPLGDTSCYPMKSVLKHFHDGKSGKKGMKDNEESKRGKEEKNQGRKNYFKRLENGQFCFLFLLSVACNEFYRRVQESGMYDHESRGRPARSVDLNCSFEVLLDVIESGARKGILSFQSILGTANNGDGSECHPLLCDVVADILQALASPLLNDRFLATLPSTFINDIKCNKSDGIEPRISNSSPSSLFMNTFQYNLHNVCRQSARTLKVYQQYDKNKDNNDNNNDEEKSIKNEIEKFPKKIPILFRLIEVFINIHDFQKHCIERSLKGLSVPKEHSLSKSQSTPALGEKIQFTGNRNTIDDGHNNGNKLNLTAVEQEKILFGLNETDIKCNDENENSNIKIFDNGKITKDKRGIEMPLEITSSTRKKHYRAISLMCGVFLPATPLGTEGAMGRVETILFRMRSFQEMNTPDTINAGRDKANKIEVKNKIKSNQIKEAAESKSNLKKLKDGGGEEGKENCFSASLDYISSDEDEDHRDSEGSQISPTSTMRKDGRKTVDSSYDRTLQSVRDCLGDGEEYKTIRYYSEYDRGKNDSTEKMRRSAAYAVDPHHREINSVLRHKEALLKYLNCLNVKASNRQKVLRKLLGYRELVMEMRRQHPLKNTEIDHSRKADIEYIVKNVTIIRSSLEAESAGTQDPQPLGLVSLVSEGLHNGDFPPEVRLPLASLLGEISALETGLATSHLDALHLIKGLPKIIIA